MLDVYQQLKKLLGPNIKEDVILAPYTTFKIGGPADLFVEVGTTNELINAITNARKLGIAVYVFGGFSNLLILDKGIRGLVIKNNSNSMSVRAIKGSFNKSNYQKSVYVEVDSGVSMNRFVRFTLEEGLAGLEMHLGLPGTVGGAIYMNSKWNHPEGFVGDSVYQAKIFTKEGKEEIVPRSYFRFGYDQSNLQKTLDIVLSVTFHLRKGNKENLWQIANESISYRRASQPQGIFSAGCIFKNISKSDAFLHSTPNFTTSAGFLIDHAGLKGYQIGGAQISPIHANFILNVNNAKAIDVIKLIEKAKIEVQMKFGVKLQEEIIRVGEYK